MGGIQNSREARSHCEISSSGLNISDNQIKNCVRLAKEKLSKEAAAKTWELGKLIGVSYSGEEDGMIQKIVEMEERDRNIISSTGIKSGCQ